MAVPDFPAARDAISANSLLENQPRLWECSWIFSFSETATAFLSFLSRYGSANCYSPWSKKSLCLGFMVLSSKNKGQGTEVVLTEACEVLSISGFAKGWFPKGWFWKDVPWTPQTGTRAQKTKRLYQKPERGYICQNLFEARKGIP